MSNKALLTIVIVLLVGIGGVVLMQANEKSPSEKIADGISDTADDIGDKIEDATDN